MNKCQVNPIETLPPTIFKEYYVFLFPMAMSSHQINTFHLPVDWLAEVLTHLYYLPSSFFFLVGRGLQPTLVPFSTRSWNWTDDRI